MVSNSPDPDLSDDDYPDGSTLLVFGRVPKWADVSQPHSLAIELEPGGPQPRHFDALPARSEPFIGSGFTGTVAHGASCNCSVITLTPHCNGTHTESVGHLTRDPWHVHRIIPAGLLPAQLVSVWLVRGADLVQEDSDPPPQPEDLLVTRAALLAAWLNAAAKDTGAVTWPASALVIRTLPNTPAKRQRDYSDGTAPYLTRQAMQEIVARGIEHLIVDLPSVDRSHDQGRLTSHRVFFGLPRGSRKLGDAQRPLSTITELAYVDNSIADGAYALNLQVPAITGDAVPSRPLLFRLRSA